jgi:hypothetical protein
MKKEIVLKNHQHDIEIGDDIITVDFTCELHGESNGIGHYEFWGSCYYDEGDYYLILNHLKWEESLYTKEQNEAIQTYINNDDNWFKIEDSVTEIIYSEWDDRDEYYDED